MKLKKIDSKHTQQTFVKIAEDRLARFFLLHGLQITEESAVWRAIKQANRPREQGQLRFEHIYVVKPDLKPRIEFLRLDKLTRRDLTVAITQRADCKLTQHANDLCPGQIDGYVFNFDGIQGGLIMHILDLAQDRQSGSMYWQVGERLVRLQRFAEFCLAMRACDWGDTPTLATPNLYDDYFRLFTSPLSATAIKLYLFWQAAAGDPSHLLRLHHQGYPSKFRLVEGLSYLHVSPEVLAQIILASQSTIKRALGQLVESKLLVRVSVGHQRFAYRCSIKSGA